MSIYNECVAAGIKVSNHYSDLYVPDNEVTRAILKKYDVTYSFFTNQQTNTRWIEIPFMYEPYWEKRLANTENV